MKLNKFEENFLAYLKTNNETLITDSIINTRVDIYSLNLKENLVLYCLKHRSIKSFYLIFNHILPDYNHPRNTSCLHYSIENNLIEESIHMIKNNYDINVENSNGLNVLEISTEMGCIEIIQLIIIDKKYSNRDKIINSLKLSIRKNYLKIFDFLINYIENLDNTIAKDLLLTSIQNDNLYSFEFFLSLLGEDINEIIIKDNKILHLCIEYSSEKIFHNIIQLNIDSNVKNKDGEVPLIIAIKKDNFKFFEALINKKVNRKVKDSHNLSPTDYAYQSRKTKFLKYLIDEKIIESVNKFITNYSKFFMKVKIKSLESSYYDDESMSPKYSYKIDLKESELQPLRNDYRFIENYIIPILDSTDQYNLLNEILSEKPVYTPLAQDKIFGEIKAIFDCIKEELNSMKI